MLWLSGGLAACYGALWVNSAPSFWRSVAKTLPVALLAVWAGSHGVWVLVLALALSALGDWALSKDGERAFLIGLSAFALAHIAYIVLFLSQAEGGDTRWGVWPALFGLMVLAGSTWHWLLPYTGTLRVVVMIYVVLITVMGGTTLFQPNAWIIGGAFTFITSDILLALNVFREVRSTSRALWILYWGGQALIVWAVLGIG